MSDLIDKRNEKERIGRSIIKRWNVNYMQMPMQINSDQKKQEKEQKSRAENTYNAKTGSHSGLYGQKEVDSLHKGQIEKILQEKSKTIREMVENELE